MIPDDIISKPVYRKLIERKVEEVQKPEKI